MNKNIFFLVLGFLFFSCSSDKGNDSEVETSASIVGTWDATELRINEETASDNAFFAREVLNLLTDKDCYIITLTFNGDLTATAVNSGNYIEIDETSLDIPCPTESDTESSTYTYESNVVSFVDTDGQIVEVDVTIDGNVMLVDAADLQIPEFNESGQLVFVKR